MWSVGIIAYLLLVGHSPFNLALRITEPVAREGEVLRLAALGLVDSNTGTWAWLSPESRGFLMSLFKPQGTSRMSPEEAWAHKFITRHAPVAEDLMRSPSAAYPSVADKRTVWVGLDGFQRLSWLAIARAVAEPELLEGLVFRHLILGQQLGSAKQMSYVEQLAMELAGTAVPAWFHTNTAWADVLRLAFRYLDSDVDGVLGVTDLMRHVVGDDAEKMSGLWLLRWQGAPTSASKSPMETPGICFADFRLALWSTLGHRHRVEEQRNGSSPDGKTTSPPMLNANGATKGIEDSMEEAALMARMTAIAEVCDQFIENDDAIDQFIFDMDSSP